MALGIGTNVVEVVIRAKDQFSATFSKATLSLQSFRKGALAAGAAAAVVGAGLLKAVKTSIDFESAFTGVRKTVDLTEQEFGDLEQRFKDLSTVTPITFVELSRIGELAGQLGVEGVDNLEKFTKTIAQISVTTNLTAEEAATSFARIANVMQEPIDNVDKMGSVVVELGNNFATTEGEIVQFAQRIAGAGKIVGFSTSDILAVGAALSSVGVNAEAGGTAIQTTLLKINGAIAKNSEELLLFADTAGMTVDEFSAMWEKDAMGAFQEFVKGLGKSGDKAQIILENVELGGVRTARSLLSLSGAGDILGDAVNSANKEWIDNNALVEEADKRFATLKAQLEIVKNKFLLIAESIGDRLEPLIKEYLIPALDWLIKMWGKLSENQQELIVITGLVTVVVGTLAVALLAIATVGVTVVLVITAIIVAITGLIMLIKNWREILLETLKTLINFAKGTSVIMAKLGHVLERVWVGIKNSFINAWNDMVNFAGDAINKLLDMMEPLVNIFNKLSSKFGGPQINMDTARAELSAATTQLTKPITNMDELKQQQAGEITALKLELDKAGQEILDMAEEKMAKKEENKGPTVNVAIEQLFASDGQEVAQTLSEFFSNELSTKTSL